MELPMELNSGQIQSNLNPSHPPIWNYAVDFDGCFRHCFCKRKIVDGIFYLVCCVCGERKKL